MANPYGPGAPGTTAGNTDQPPIPPLDPEQVLEIQLLAEAQLVSFTAIPSSLKPFGHATLAWEVKMPTTQLPGVHIEVHLFGGDDQLVEPKGSKVFAPFGDTAYTIYLKTPLGTLDLGLDFGACTSVDTAAAVFTAAITSEANKAFPTGGQVRLRGSGSSVDIGFNSFVVDIPLTASVPNWFDPDVDVSLGFSVSSHNEQVVVTHDFAKTKVSFGTASSILSAGCSAAVAAALEAQSDGFLTGFIGPVVAGRIADALVANLRDNLSRLNHSVPLPPVPYRFYDLTLTVDGLTYRFCLPTQSNRHIHQLAEAIITRCIFNRRHQAGR
jgi:hypothetical protein